MIPRFWLAMRAQARRFDPSPMEVAEWPTAEIHESIEEGRMLDAWEQARSTGVDLAKWPSGAPRRAAARLANTLGAQRLGRALDWLNWRARRDDPKFYFHALFTRVRSTPESTLIPEIRSFLDADRSMPAQQRGDLLAFLGVLHAGVRDFEPAYRCIDESLDLLDDAWVHVEHSIILEAADRYDEALEAARRAVERRATYGPAVSQCAECLGHLGREDEGIRLLEEADRATQNAVFALRLQALHSEREDPRSGLRCLDRVEACSPLAEKELTRWIAGRRADFHFMDGDIDACLEWCDRKGEGFHKRIAATLREPGARSRRRVCLEVPFTRQHQMTCAPATLSSLAAFWNRPHDHLAIAEAICHEGTPWHKERQWIVEHGFVAREFRLTREVLHQLIDRGVPFTLTTQSVTSAHLQACIGYDDRAGVVLLRDPTERHTGEMILDSLLEAHPIGGPRGMVMIPPEEAGRLEGMSFPDEAVYDAHHELLIALDGHDRLLIEAALSTLRAVAGEHPLAIEAEERVATWKGDWPGQLAKLEELLKVAPKHGRTLLQKAYALRRLGRWQDLRRFLEEVVADEDADPVFVSELGELLMEDARLLPRAEHFLRKAVRQRRREARVYESLARCRSKQQRHEEARVLRRIASCLSPAYEPYASAHFETCRILRRADEGIAFLEQRTRRFGTKDGGPWITLAEALNGLDRVAASVEVLKQGAVARPDDGEFRLSAGSMMAGWGEPHRSLGLEWMEDARGRVPETRWLLESARIAGYLGDRAKALRCWRSLRRLQPRLIDAWRGLARSVAEEEGEDAAIALLDEGTAEHPDLSALWALKAEWLAGTERGPLEALDRLLELDPGDLWGVRERAIRRIDADHPEGAELDAREAVALDPWSAESHGILGSVLEEQGRKAEAAESFREAIRLRVDYTFAAQSLCRIAADRDERLEAIRFIEAEMRRQVSTGEIVPTYQTLAWDSLQPPVLLRQLQEFCEERPDLWQTWSARVEQALRMRLDGEAVLAAERLTESFPLMPRAWLELARVHRTHSRHAEEEQAAARAVALSPGWDEAAREHAHVLEMLGRPEEAIAVLRRACQLDPLNGANHGCLADVLRRLGRRGEALDTLRSALESSPYYVWGWNQACSWAVEDGREDELAASLEAATARNGHNPSWWSVAADAWDSLGRDDEAGEAVRRGLELKPDSANLRDTRALRLFDEQRYDEALAVCAPAGGESVAPVNLRGRRAWILMHSGEPSRGVAEMKALLEEEPGYSWGLGELATWYEERRDWKSLREHSVRWLRSAPHHLRALACLGTAESQLGNREAAKRAFTRAHSLEPEYLYPARQLLDLQLQDGELDQAAATLASLEHYAPGPMVTCDGIELDLKRGDPEAALRRAERLIEDPEAGPQAFHWVAELFSKAQQPDRWRSWLSERMTSGPVTAPGALPAFLALLPEKRLARDGRKWIERQPEGSPGRTEGWRFLIKKLAQQRADKELRALARRPELHRDPELWNTLGDGFVETDQPKAGLAWYGDWRQRPDDLRDSTYLNLAALHDSAKGSEKEHWRAAGELRREGMQRFPDGGSTQALRAGHAFHLAVDGRHDEAAAVLENFEGGQTSDYYRSIAEGAEAIVHAARDEQEPARGQLCSALEVLARFNDRGTVRLRDKLERSVARLTPWARGRVGTLRRRWGLPKGARAGGELPLPVWGLIVLVIGLIRACSEIGG